MPRQRIQLHCQIRAPIERVYDFFCDHESFGRIWPGKIRRIRDSSDPNNPNGIGSVRRICIGPICFEETHTVCDRPRLIEYKVSRGSPIKNHTGRICFSEKGQETEIHYSIEFDARIPFTGGLIARNLENDWAKGIQPVIRELESA